MRLKIVDERNESINSGSLNTNKDLSGKFCSNPFSFFEIKNNGDVSLCCSSWLPEIIGNINDSTIDEIFNSERAQEIRKSILDGSFKYCDHAICPKIQSGDLPYKNQLKDQRYVDIVDNNKVIINHPSFINFVFDPSCNLSCPSCRIKKILHTSGPEYEKMKNIERKITEELKKINSSHSYTINVTGSGDPFGSKIFRDFLFNFDGSNNKNIKINLQTNGVMFTPAVWKRMYKIHDNIYSVIVSIDAATETTYNKIRVGGNWNTLIENMKFMSSLRRQNKIKNLRVDYVVQKYNYMEMKDFVLMFLSRDYDVDVVNFSALNDWGTWNKKDFLDMAIWHKENVLYDDFVKSMKDPIFNLKNVWLGNLSSYRDKA